MERLLERLKAEYPEAEEAVERFAPAILHVVPETMEQFLAELRSRYGTYGDLAASLGVVDAMTARRHRAGRRLTGAPAPPCPTRRSDLRPPAAPVVPSRGR